MSDIEALARRAVEAHYALDRAYDSEAPIEFDENRFQKRDDALDELGRALGMPKPRLRLSRYGQDLLP
jgi:hypothetical protein